MSRKLTAAEHLQSYLADIAARKVEAGARRRIPYGDGLYLFIAGPRSCRWRYDYRHRGVLTSAFWPAIGAAALGEKEAKAARSKLWLANYEERQQALQGRREARRRTRLGLPAIPAQPAGAVGTAEMPVPSAPAPGAIMTFGQAWERYARAQRGGWDSAKRNGRTEKRYRGLVARYCRPILDMPVTEITVDDVATVLNSKTSRGTPLWRGSDSDGHKLRVFIESALDLAGVEPNPAALKAKLRQLLPKNTNGHGSDGYAWLHPDDLPDFMRELVALGDDEHARVLRWQILTTARPEEARQARWEEIDLKAKTWTLPREKTKKGQRAFVFHLSDAAIAALGEPRAAGPVFRVTEDSRKHWRESGVMTKWLARDKRPATYHGFRHCFMVWAEMTARNVDAADAVLQHEKRLSKIARKYAKHDYEVERARLLREWADYAVSIIDQ
jgi:integrase